MYLLLHNKSSVTCAQHQQQPTTLLPLQFCVCHQRYLCRNHTSDGGAEQKETLLCASKPGIIQPLNQPCNISPLFLGDLILVAFLYLLD